MIYPIAAVISVVLLVKNERIEKRKSDPRRMVGTLNLIHPVLKNHHDVKKEKQRNERKKN